MALAITTKRNVRTYVSRNGPKTLPIPSETCDVVHHHGWYTGSGLRNTGSTVPNATETMT
jgi:hypothetical protein